MIRSTVWYKLYCSDAGFYECQVSTTPPIGQQVKLSVVGREELETIDKVGLREKNTEELREAYYLLVENLH